MKVLTFLPRCDLQRRVAKALSSAQFVVETVVSARECLQLTRFAPYEGVLVDSDSLIFGDIVLLVKLLRQENSDASLFVFARYLDLEQRLQLFEAGVDDCVREPFFASELAVRLGLSIRLRQAAADLAAANAVNVLRSGELELDLVRRRAARLGKSIDLRPEGISAARVPGEKRQPSGHANHDPGTCMELLVRGFDQRGRCVYQRLTKQSRSRLPAKIDSDQPGYRIHPYSGDPPPPASNGHGVRPPQSSTEPLAGHVRLA